MTACQETNSKQCQECDYDARLIRFRQSISHLQPETDISGGKINAWSRRIRHQQEFADAQDWVKFI